MSLVMRDRIVGLHGAQVLKRSALNIRGGAGVFERVLAGKGYRTVVEIGTLRGCAAAEISRYCERVVTFDLAFGRLERLGESWDRRAFWDSLGITNIEFHAIANDAEKRRVIDGLKFDLAFIDGAHDVGSVTRDFEMVKRCGRVLFHDYDFRGVPAQDQVYNFINSLPREQIEVMDIFALWTGAAYQPEKEN